MGGVQGGIWRSENYGHTWENISDGKLGPNAYGIGALAVAATNPKIIYAGTGEPDIRQDFAPGAGSYKTTHASKTGHYIGLEETHQINSHAIDPRNPDVLCATSLAPLAQ